MPMPRIIRKLNSSCGSFRRIASADDDADISADANGISALSVVSFHSPTSGDFR